MRVVLARNWWALVLRGVIGMLLGAMTFAWPGITLSGLVLLVGAYALIDGAMSIVSAVRAAEAHERWGASIIEGLFGIVAAFVIVAWPAITTLVLVYVIAGWALATGVSEIVAAVRLRKHISGEWLLALSGAASIGFGLLIALAPLTGALVIALWFGAYIFVSGLILLMLGLRLRAWSGRHLSGPSITVGSH
ncbi:MAG: DUF308 domain-containing protein [Acidobacteriota bacterium]